MQCIGALFLLFFKYNIYIYLQEAPLLILQICEKRNVRPEVILDHLV